MKLSTHYYNKLLNFIYQFRSLDSYMYTEVYYAKHEDY